jgi:hypothetical protein
MKGLVVGVLTSLLFAAQANASAIDRAVSEADRYAKAHGPQRIFAQLGCTNDEATGWRELKSVQDFRKEASEAQCSYVALVTLQDGSVLLVHEELGNGDFFILATHYYRRDGTLAFVRSRLDTFHGNVSVLRTAHYDARGVVLRRSQRVLDLKTQKAVDPAKKPFMDSPTPLYRTTSELPFFHLLAR